jgi:hypothetical protein
MLRIPHCLDSRLADGGKVVSFTHRPRFAPEKHFFLFTVLIFIRDVGVNPRARPKGLGKWKKLI